MSKKQRNRPLDDENEEIPPIFYFLLMGTAALYSAAVPIQKKNEEIPRMLVSFDSGSAGDFRQSAVVSESRDQPAKKNK